MSIVIRNKLEILPGNVLRVPGCEPVSSFTSLSLAANIDCNASVISLKDAVLAIEKVTGERPRIVVVLRPTGLTGTGKFLELPDGPPPQGRECPCKPASEDWYKILKEAAKPLDFGAREDGIPEGCDGFNFSGRRLNVAEDKNQRLESFDEVASFHRAPDPRLRPTIVLCPRCVCSFVVGSRANLRVS